MDKFFEAIRTIPMPDLFVVVGLVVFIRLSLLNWVGLRSAYSQRSQWVLGVLVLIGSLEKLVSKAGQFKSELTF